MKRQIAVSSLILSLALSGAKSTLCAAVAKEPKVDQPLNIDAQTTSLPQDQHSIGGLSAPGANALMTPDMLLVNPQGQSQPPQPLKAYIGVSLTLTVDRTDIKFDRLGGILVTVVNETNRPLVINGEKGVAIVGGKTFNAAPVQALQTIVIPPHKASQILEDILTKIVPAAATIGVTPTAKDIITSTKPVLDRYGADEVRRRVESSRFGRRVLWPRAKTTGVLYFDTSESLTGAQVQMPASTLFDLTDSGLLVSVPAAAGAQPELRPPITSTTQSQSTTSTTTTTTPPATVPPAADQPVLK
ncbi:MAG TPA: hypothetical protein V6C81_30360 [Planktothrix sp.]|jgi:hypothetical protein